MNTTARATRRRPPAWGFGDRLRVVRRDLRLTQAEMAMKIGVGLKSYSSWESGQARPADMVERAELLEASTGIERAWWLGWADGDGDGGPSTRNDGQNAPIMSSSVTHEYPGCIDALDLGDDGERGIAA